MHPLEQAMRLVRKARDESTQVIVREKLSVALGNLEAITDVDNSTRNPPPHGTRARYYGAWQCRCDECKSAQAAYMRDYRKTHA